jgi:Flavodoxin
MNDIRSERPRALVVYESMFGCTESVARAVADGLEEGGFSTRLEEVRNAERPDRRGFDLLVVGAPTHAFSLSRPSTRADAVRQGGRPEAAEVGLREWITGIGDEGGRHRPAAAFDTRVTKVRHLPKAASTRAAHLLARRSFELVERPAPFFVADLKGPLLDGELDRARAWGRRLASTHVHDHPLPGTAVG